MTVLDDVEALVRRAELCDDCIATKLGMENRQHANIKTRLLADAGYIRKHGHCSSCGSDRKITTKRP